MALISGAVIVTGTIAPTDTDDVYATHDSKYGKGGYREVVFPMYFDWFTNKL